MNAQVIKYSSVFARISMVREDFGNQYRSVRRSRTGYHLHIWRPRSLSEQLSLDKPGKKMENAGLEQIDESGRSVVFCCVRFCCMITE